MEINIKRKIRLNLPETNSSSSHSLVIGYDSGYLRTRMDVLRELEPYLDNNGILIVNSAEFGWEVGKFNNVYEKLQYLMAISYSYNGGGWENESVNDRAKVQKLLVKIEKIVKDYTGIIGVKFETEGSSVDHQSVDLYTDIIESSRSIKNFLFSSQSWVFLGNDNSDINIGEMEMGEKTYYGLLTVHIPGEIGNIECPLLEPVDNKYELDSASIFNFSEDAKAILMRIVLTKGSDGTIYSKCRSDLGNDMNYIINNTVYNSVSEEYYFTQKLVKKDGEWFILWAKPEIMIAYLSQPINILSEEREDFLTYDRLPKDKIILVEADLILDEYGHLNLFKKEWNRI